MNSSRKARTPGKTRKRSQPAGNGSRRGATTVRTASASVDLMDQDLIEDEDVFVSEGAVLTDTGDDTQIALPEPNFHVAPKLADKPSFRGFLKSVFQDASNWRELGRTPYGLKPTILLTAIAFFQVFDTAGFSIAGPDIVRDLNIELTSLLGVRSLVGFFAIFAALGFGWYADRHKRIPIFAIGTVFSGVFSIVSARARSLLSLGVPRVVDDVSNLAADVPSFSLLADYYPPETRGKVFALLGNASRSAILLVPVLGFMIDGIGWRATTAIFGAPIVILGFFSFLLKEPVRGYMERKALGASEEVARQEDEPQSFGEGFRTIFAVRTLRRVFFAQIVLAGTGPFNFFVAFLLADRYGLDASDRALVSLAPTIVGLIGGYLGGGLVDTFIRRNPGRILIIIGVYVSIGALGQVGLALTPPLWILIVFSTINGFGSALIGPATGVVFVQVLPATVRTQGVQFLGLSGLPALLLVPPVAGAIFKNGGYEAVLFAAVPFYIIGGLIIASAASLFDLDMRSALATSMADHEWRRARDAGKGKMLVCRNVDVAYDGVQVLFNVDFDLEEGEIIALLGTNGAGKSTLLRAISGTTEASGGAIVFDGRDITHMPPHEIAGRNVIHMPGGRGTFPGLTVRENLLMGRWLEEGSDVSGRIEEILEIFPILKERSQSLAGSLSGGEQQQLSLAQALLAKPKLLMIDELSLGLSPAVIDQLLEQVREIHRRGVSIIVVEQSVNVALRIAQKAIFMEKGEVRFFGNTKDLLDRPDILRAVYVRGTAGLDREVQTVDATERARRTRELEEARSILSVTDLSKTYGGITAVDQVSFDIAEGSVVGFIGPNGAGKTTLFDLISGYQTPDTGKVEFQGLDITNLTPEQRANRKLIRRFQDARLFPSLTVQDTLLVALEQRHQVRNALFNMAQTGKSRREEKRLRLRTERLMELLGLTSYRDKFIRELSTGLRRLTDLGCVLAADPEVLLLDEPSTGVAQKEAENLVPLLRQVRTETGCTILIIEHAMQLISAVSDELIALDQGAFVTRGRPDDVLNDDRVAAAYLGAAPAPKNKKK